MSYRIQTLRPQLKVESIGVRRDTGYGPVKVITEKLGRKVKRIFSKREPTAGELNLTSSYQTAGKERIKI